MDAQIEQIVHYVLAYIEKSLLENPQKTRLRKNTTPDTLFSEIPISLSNNRVDSVELIKLIEKVIDNSVHTNHPFFMNQMFGKTQPLSFIADLLISLLNTSMYTYEVAPVFSLIEKEVVTQLGAKIWGVGKGDGVFTAGGSMSNMNALFLARQHHLKQAKQLGLCYEKPIAIFVSEQAHYSFTKGVNFLGFGLNSLIKIPSKTNAQIDTDALQKAIDLSKQQGRIPMMLIGIAGTTISGSFDDLEQLAKIAQDNKLWFHVDAAYGGSLLFSKKHAKKLRGIDKANSVTWNFHKVMGMNLSTSSFLTQEKGLLNQAFNVKAGYLFHEDNFDYDLGQKSLQGGRRPDAFKLWLTWKYKGDTGLSTHVEKLCVAAENMAASILSNTKLELFMPPQSSIVCFRYKGDIKDEGQIDTINKKIRNTIFEQGELLFNYSVLNDSIYLRCVILDPEISASQLHYILDKIVTMGDKLTS